MKPLSKIHFEYNSPVPLLFAGLELPVDKHLLFVNTKQQDCKNNEIVDRPAVPRRPASEQVINRDVFFLKDIFDHHQEDKGNQGSDKIHLRDA